MSEKKISVLGTEYTIKTVKYDEEEAFDRRSIAGFCDGYTKEIIVCDMHTYKGWEHEAEKTIEICHKQNIRHEIVHAFFMESGLRDNALDFDGPWCSNEELVDWIAWKGPQIYEAWKAADAL